MAISYTATTWKDYPDTSTPITATQLNRIETGVSSLVTAVNALRADGTAAAPAVTFDSDTDTGLYNAGANRLGFTTAGTKALEIAADGKVLFGNATDTNLYRSAADTLKTDDQFVAGNGIVANNAVQVTRAAAGGDTVTTILGQLDTDTLPRIRMRVSGKMEWGDGTSVDTNLYRSAADTLKTDDSLVVAGDLTVSGSMAAAGGAWTSYTPSLSGWTIGNGTIAAHYCKIGKLVEVRVIIVWGSTTSASGTLTVTLPFTAASTSFSVGAPLGGAMFLDNGSAVYSGIAAYNNTTTCRFYAQLASGTYASQATVNATVPHTWADTDRLETTFVYEAA